MVSGEGVLVTVLPGLGVQHLQRTVVLESHHPAAHLQVPLVVRRVGRRHGDPIVVLEVAPLLATLQVGEPDVGPVEAGPHGGDLGLARWPDGGHVPDGREVEQVAVCIRDNSHEKTVALGYR